jgi:hypothetical protein
MEPQIVGGLAWLLNSDVTTAAAAAADPPAADHPTSSFHGAADRSRPPLAGHSPGALPLPLPLPLLLPLLLLLLLLLQILQRLLSLRPAF